MTASAHIVTAVIGAGVLSLAWATAQLGWVAGAIAIMGFSVITWYTSTLLADCYRSSDPATGKRNYTYMDAVKANLGNQFSFVISFVCLCLLFSFKFFIFYFNFNFVDSWLQRGSHVLKPSKTHQPTLPHMGHPIQFTWT